MGVDLREVGVPDHELAAVRFRYESRVGGPRAFERQMERFSTYWIHVVRKRPDNPGAALTAWMKREAESYAANRKAPAAPDPTLERRFLALWERVAAGLVPEILRERERPERVPVEAWHEHAQHEARLWALQRLADREVDVASDESVRARAMIRSVSSALNRRRVEFREQYDCDPPGCTGISRLRELRPVLRRVAPMAAAEALAEDW